MDKDCSELGILFQETVSDIKASFSIWEEFTNKAAKLSSAIKVTIGAGISFQEAFVKVAEIANGTRGAHKDFGLVLLKLCARHQALEIKLKAYAMSLIELLVNPIQKTLDDWQKSVGQLDRDHSKDYKKAQNDLKRASGEAIRLKKKINKGKTELQARFDETSRLVSAKFVVLEEVERRSVTSALLQERSHLCFLASCLKPVLDQEVSLLSEFHHLQDIADNLSTLSTECNSSLPASVDQVICDASRMNSSSVEGKKKSSKVDPRIQAVVGCDDSIQTTLSSSDSMDSLQAKLGSTGIQDTLVKHDQDDLQNAIHSSYDMDLYSNQPPVSCERPSSFSGSDDEFDDDEDYDDDGDDNNDIDDLPPPPPPEVLISSVEKFGGPICSSNAFRKQSATLPRNMAAAQNLSDTMTSRNFMKRGNECSGSSNWSDRPSEQSVEAEEASVNSFTRQLNSVKLKRAASYNRSSPVTKKQ